MDDARLTRRLRTLAPVKCFAIVDGERREVSVGAPGSRGRWQRVLDAARAMGADGIECVDSAGAVLDVLTFDAVEASSANMSTRAGDTRTSSARDAVTDVERIVALALDAADRAVIRHGEHTRIALDALARVCEAVAERAERLERALAALAAASPADGDTSGTDRLAALTMAMLAGPGALNTDSTLTNSVNGSKKTE